MGAEAAVGPIAIVMRRFWPLVGGTEEVLANLAVELAARGAPVTVLTACWQPHWPAEIRYHDVAVVRLSPPPEGRWNTWRFSRALGRWLRSYQDQLSLVYVSQLGHEAAAAVRAMGTRAPVVLRAERAGCHGDCVWQIDAHGGRRIKGACLKAAAFVAPTPPIRRELQAAGYPLERIHSISNGVPLPSPRTPAARTAARAALAEANVLLQLPDRAMLAVYVGPLEQGRDVGHLVAAWPEVLQQRPSARLWLAGPSADRYALPRQIESLGLTTRVVPIGTFDDLEPLLTAADLFVSPSSEGANAGILEAMAAGLPVVGVAGLFNEWLVADGQAGVLVPSGDTPALAAGISRILAQPELAARLGAAARDRAAREFSLAKMVDEHLTLFQHLSKPVS